MTIDLAELWTEPLTVVDLSKLFGCSRRTMPSILDDLGDDARKLGTRWQVRCSRMPPRYLLGVGLVVSRTVDGQLCEMLGSDPQPWNAAEYLPAAYDEHVIQRTLDGSPCSQTTPTEPRK